MGTRPERPDAAAAPGPVGAVAWGAGDQGRLGDGGTCRRCRPVTVRGPGALRHIAAGHRHSLAVDADGTVWTWGHNTYGQLGRTGTDGTAPMRVPALRDIVQVAAGGFFSLALASDGTVWAWGRNTRGELGDGGGTDRSEAAVVTRLAGVRQIAAGDAHGLALLADGTVRAWGAGGTGQLGDGGTTDRATPVTVADLTGVTQVSAGGGHCLALLPDGTVRAWGGNAAGQLGDGTTGDHRGRPVTVPELAEVAQVSAGGAHSMALCRDGIAKGWGSDFHGQLGSGRGGGYRTTPAPVTGLAGVTLLSAGVLHTLAMLPPRDTR